MGFPSLGCLTCKRRRIKCDSIRPTCSRCSKASRSCVWRSNEETGLSFRSENAFAQGRPRRPRGHIVTRAVINSSPASPPTIPLETHAFHYWVEHFTAWPDDFFDIGLEYGTYALRYWTCAAPNSSLQLAVSAFSLAVFGLARNVNRALGDAERLYGKSIARIREEIAAPSNRTIDQLLVAILLMANYDNIMRQPSSSQSSAKAGSTGWRSTYHCTGIVGLLQARQQQGFSQNTDLDRALRRPIIRSCILRGVSLPKWLQYDALYIEDSPISELDTLMIQVADIRAKAQNCLQAGVSIFQLGQLDELVLGARQLDSALVEWTQRIPSDWTFFENLGSAYTENSLPCYTSRGYAATLNRYRAVRLIINSLRIRLLSTMSRITQSMGTELEQCQANISSLTACLCHSIPSFFDVATTEHNITPKMAIVLAWPLTVAVSTEAVPTTQRKWLQDRLHTVASVIGADRLHTVAESGEFNF
ncbi:hypothetical protein N7510_009608 [Penicillium lagena]|uniref:uncharacterized protein n=1 Tax=Penicillium lagena TaxID=94218 RepID=UPI00254207B4|nr:uncharacterized protein N7510_009608 [Penicillium lagena]KAJ5604454.1 hypothetical protein N7510_009608 [Penicillium lagena]